MKEKVSPTTRMPRNFIPRWEGWGLEELGEFEEAINCYDKALKINLEHKMAGEYKEACLQKL